MAVFRYVPLHALHRAESQFFHALLTAALYMECGYNAPKYSM